MTKDDKLKGTKRIHYENILCKMVYINFNFNLYLFKYKYYNIFPVQYIFMY